MNQEEYYLNQDMTTECILLPNLFQQGDCLIKQNYLSEFINYTDKVWKNLGLTDKFAEISECCDNVHLSINDINTDILNVKYDIDQLEDKSITLDLVLDEIELALEHIGDLNQFIPINNNSTLGPNRLSDIYIKGKENFVVDVEDGNINFNSKNLKLSGDSSSTTDPENEHISYFLGNISLLEKPFLTYVKTVNDTGSRKTEYMTYTLGNADELSTISLLSRNPINREVRTSRESKFYRILDESILDPSKVILNNDGKVEVTCDEFKISSSLTITDDSTLLKYNDDELITYNNLKQLIFNSNNGPLYRTYPGGNAVIYDSKNFNADTIKVYKTKLEGDIISNEDSFKDALLALENAIKNLPSGGGSGECDCPELPDWLNDYIDNAPEFIETIKLNGNELPVTDKTVNILIGASDGLEIDNNYIVKHTNSINNTLPSSEILCKIKFDEQGHITSYLEITINDLAAQLLGTGLFEPSSDYVEVESVQITPASATLTDDNNHTLQLSATTYDANNQEATNLNITWSSSDSSIVSVNSNGLITGQKTGTATITATSHNGKTTSIEVNVLFSTVYYFSVGTTPVTANNYTSVNNPTRDIPEEKLYTSNERVRHYILIPDNKSLNIVDNNISSSIPITKDNSAQIPNHIVYYTNGAIGSGATVKITLSQLEN